MARIRNKDLSPGDRNQRRNLLWEVLLLNEIIIYKVVDGREGSDAFFVICNDDNCELLLKDETKTNLKKKGFDIQTPPDVEAKRSVIARNVDRYVTDDSAEDIKNNIENRVRFCHFHLESLRQPFL